MRIAPLCLIAASIEGLLYSGKGELGISAQTDGERLVRVEGAYQHLATKADIERLQVDLIKWFTRMGLGIATIPLAITSIIVSMAISCSGCATPI